MKSLVTYGTAGILSILVFCHHLTAATFRVPSEYPTIEAAIWAADSCDTILLDSGVYKGTGFKDLSLVGTCLKIISEHGPSLTIVDLEGGRFLKVSDTNYDYDHKVDVEGITFTRGSPVIEYGLYAHINIQHCVFVDNSIGILDSVWWAIGGIIDSCQFIDNDTAIRFYDECYQIVSNSVFKGNDVAINSLFGFNATLRGNVFVRNLIAVWLEGSNFRIENNLIYRNWWGVYDWMGGSSLLFFSCNDVFGNAGNFGGTPDPTGTNGNISVDPMFCDTMFSQFSVASVSPLIAANNECGIDIAGVTIGCYCGDVDASGTIDVSDLTYLVAYMFGGGPPPNPVEAGEINGNGTIDISDLTFLVAYMFGGGSNPACGGFVATPW